MERLLELPTAQTNHENDVDAYPLLDALRQRRSRRFGHGMKIDSGPFAYRSEHPPQPLSEEEEAFLAFAACGITGYRPGRPGLRAGPGRRDADGTGGPHDLKRRRHQQCVAGCHQRYGDLSCSSGRRTSIPPSCPRSSIWPSAATWSPGTGAAGSRSTTGGPRRRWSRAITSISTSGRCTPKAERICCLSTN